MLPQRNFERLVCTQTVYLLSNDVEQVAVVQMFAYFRIECSTCQKKSGRDPVLWRDCTQGLRVGLQVYLLTWWEGMPIYFRSKLVRESKEMHQR